MERLALCENAGQLAKRIQHLEVMAEALRIESRNLLSNMNLQTDHYDAFSRQPLGSHSKTLRKIGHLAENIGIVAETI